MRNTFPKSEKLNTNSFKRVLFESKPIRKPNFTNKLMIKQRVYFCINLLIVAVLFSGCSFLPSASRTQQIADDEATPTPIPTAIVPTKPTYSVKLGEVVDELEFSARITAVEEEDLFFRVDGHVRNIYLKRDAIVKEGDIIADLEIDNLERELTVVNLDLERAEVRLAIAERNHAYDQEVAQKNFEIAQLTINQLQKQIPIDRDALAIAERQVELSKIAADRLSHGVDPLLKNDVERALVQVRKLEAAIQDAQLTAPFDGELLSMTLTAGQAATAYKAVAVVADTAQLEASAELLSNQMDGLAEGMTAEIVMASRPGVTLEGIVRRLPFPYGSGPSGTTIEEQDKSTRVTIDDAELEEGFDEGDLVRVKVVKERKDDVLWLPPQALRNFDGRRFAVIQDGDTQRRVDVKVGIQTTERVEIEEGLEEGQVVIGQ